MRRRQRAPIAFGIGVAAVLAVSACTSGGSGGSHESAPPATNASGSNAGVAPAFNAATVGFVNKSDKTGGSLNLLASSDCDSWDPGNTSQGWCWNLQRLFTRTLVGYASLPGANNVEVTPDLATSLGEHNGDFTSWTYHLKPGVQWQDGTPVTSQQIKYGIERLFATSVLSQGAASYFVCLLSTCDAQGNPSYQGPYQGGQLSSISTPDDSTITFSLNQSTPDFDYLMALPAAAPVPLTEGGPGYTGAKYTLKPMSDGPFKIASYTPQQQIVFVRNDKWNQSSDTIRHPLVDKITLRINANADDNDRQLQAGTADALADSGVQTAFQADIATDPDLKKYADDPVTSYVRYFAVYPQTKPLDNVHCRLAIFYAMNKSDLQRARGGSYGGAIANTMSLPTIPGFAADADPYPTGPDNTGDLAKARDELTQCGHPDGFTIKEAYANVGRAGDVFTASQQALARVGITVQPAAQQPSDMGGLVSSPTTVASLGIGLLQSGWAPDYPTGGGFWTSIAASWAPAGAGNFTQLDDPVVDGLLKQAAGSTGKHAELFSQIDAQVMKDAVYLPFVYDKTLFYRNPRLTNVRNNFALGSYYDFVNIGVDDGK